MKPLRSKERSSQRDHHKRRNLSSDEFRKKFVQVRNLNENVEFVFGNRGQIYSLNSNRVIKFEFEGLKCHQLSQMWSNSTPKKFEIAIVKQF